MMMQAPTLPFLGCSRNDSIDMRAAVVFVFGVAT
jgi:hypothetical protein